MVIKGLHISSGYGDHTIVEVTTCCYTPEDVDALIAWLTMAKNSMAEWKKIKAPQGEPSKTEQK